MFKRQKLPPPKTPRAAIESRLLRCYGCAHLFDIRRNPDFSDYTSFDRHLIQQFQEIQLHVAAMNIEVRERVSLANYPKPMCVHQSFFHLSFHGSAPLLDEDEYAKVLLSKGESNPEVLYNMRNEIQKYLHETKPTLLFQGFELIKQTGTILLRFAYQESQHSDMKNLVEDLDRRLYTSDSTKLPDKWDDKNARRQSSVVAVISVVDLTQLLSDEVKAIEDLLARKNDALKNKFVYRRPISIQGCWQISYYNQRTLSLAQNVKPLAYITSERIVLNPLDNEANTYQHSQC